MTSSQKRALLCAVTAAGFGAAPVWAQTAPGADPGQAVQVANGGKRPIIAVYTSPPGREDWSDDMLGKGTLRPGQTVKLKLKAKPDGCAVDVSAMLDNGETHIQKNIDLCASAPAVGF